MGSSPVAVTEISNFQICDCKISALLLIVVSITYQTWNSKVIYVNMEIYFFAVSKYSSQIIEALANVHKTWIHAWFYVWMIFL